MEVVIRYTFNLLILAAAAVATVGSASAEVRAVGCSERALMVDRLQSRYAETRRAAGMEVSDGIVELYVSEEGSWTLLLTQPDGMSCPLAAGDGWRETDPLPLPLGDPT